MNGSVQACALPAKRLRFAAATVLICVFALPSVAAITSNGASSSSTTAGTAPTLNWSHEVFTGSDRVLFVGLSLELGQSTSVTYSGAPLTLAGRYTGESSHTIEIWYRVAPPVGTAPILATFDTSREVIGGASAFNGVDPVTPTSGFLGNSDESDSPTVTISSAPGELVLDTLFVDVDSLNATPEASQTERWNDTNGRLGAGSTQPGAGSVVMDWTLSGSEEWTLAGVSIKPVVGLSISGTVFEDANFTGTASGFDGGAADKALQGVDVELYDGLTDAYISSTVTLADGTYRFSGLVDGSFKVRVRSSTIGSGTATPKGGLSACVPATCANPLAEMTWGNGVALYGGQSAAVDDAVTPDNGGPGDTYLPVTVSGANVSAVDFGFAYNLIVDTADDANAANVRSAQGSLRQFIKNANAIGSAGATTANASEFRMQVATNQSADGDNWWRITAAAAMTPFGDSGITLDASTQAANAAGSSNSRGPEIELYGNGVTGSGLNVDNVGGTTIRELTINSFQDNGIYVQGAGATGTQVFGCYLGTDAIGENGLPNLNHGIWVTNSASNTDIGSATPGDGNLISSNGDGSTEVELRLSGGATAVTIRGNKIGTDRTGTQPLGNLGSGIGSTSADGVTIGGTTADAGNIISGNGDYGVVLSFSTRNVTIHGNSIGVGITGGETNLGNGSYGIYVLSQDDPSNIVIGGTGAGEGNLIAENTIGIRTQTSGLGDSIQGNTIRDNNDHGIHSLTDSVLIAKNLVVNNAGRGMNLGNDSGTAANNNKVYHNTIHGSTSDGILVAGDGVLIRNNIITGSGGYGINVSVGSMTESNNLSTDAATSPVNGAGRSNVGLDASDLNLDPDYANPAGGDFTLVECTSPAIDMGLDLGGDQPDVNGSDPGLFTGTAPDMGAFETACLEPFFADLALSKTDSPDPAPLDGPLVYTLVVTNNGPSTATGVSVTDDLPDSVSLEKATPSQGSCAGTDPVVCSLGAIVASGTASVEILVRTSATGGIVNDASVTADQVDLVLADNTASANTEIVADSAISDVPLTQYRRIHGFIDYTVTGGSLRTQPNQGGGACVVGTNSTESLAGIPGTATVTAAYLYWAASGPIVDDQVTFDGTLVTADRTFLSRFSLGANDYDFFGGFKDVTAQVATKGNGSYTFEDLTIETGNPYCSSKAVLGGWSLIVIFEDTGLSGKTLVLYDGFDLERNGAVSYLLTGIYSADPPEVKTTFLVWEGDDDLGGASELLEFNGVAQSDALNPVDNVYNSTINSLSSTTSYGMDLDTFDVSDEVSSGDTLATTRVSVGPDLVILNTVVLQAKSNLIAGKVFEDVNYGGGAGRDLATAVTEAASFTVPRPDAIVELYAAGGAFLRTTTTGPAGDYGFTGLVDGDYQVRVVNETVFSSRPGATQTEWPVQTFRTDASSGTAQPVVDEVGGASPAGEDSGPNVAMDALGTIAAQSVSPVLITTGIAVPGVDFGFNFDTIVNTNDSGQGSLRQFLINSNNLTNFGLAQFDLPADTEHSLFMIPSDADPFGRAQDPGFDAVRGVAAITPDSLLPPITDSATAIDGTTQTAAVENSNTVSLGAGGTVGVEGVALPTLAGPEIEIVDDAGLIVGIDVQADDVSIRGLAIYGFGSGPYQGNIRVGLDETTNFTQVTIEDNVLGGLADSFTDPDLALPGSRSAGASVAVLGADFGTLQRNLIGFTGRNTAVLSKAANDWTVESNEFRAGGQDDARSDGLGLIDDVERTSVTGNLFADNRGPGVDFFSSVGSHTLLNNTFDGNGQGGDETTGVRMFGADGVVDRNVFNNQVGSGVLAVVSDPAFPSANTPATRQRITRNRYGGNGANAIDLQTTLDIIAPGDGITLNDGTLLGDSSVANTCGTVATHGNEGLDTPIIDLVVVGGGSSTVRGRACPGAEVEIYRAVADGDASDTLSGTDYGEGLTYLATANAAAGTGLFEVTGIVGLSVGDAVSAIAIDSNDNTSEFSGNVLVDPLLIVKRAFQADGTPLASGSTLRSGMLVKWMLYVSNSGALVADLSMRDVLDPAFLYVAGSSKYDNSVANCAGAVCTAGEEAAILAAVNSGTVGSDAVDGDVVSFSGVTLDVGNQSAANAQLDIAGSKVWAVVFTIRTQ